MDTIHSERSAALAESTASRSQLLLGFLLAAAILGTAYWINVIVRDHNWVKAAQGQARLFASASPVLMEQIGAVKQTSGFVSELIKDSPPTVQVTFRVEGQKKNGSILMDVTQGAPYEWTVSTAQFKRGTQTVNLF